MGLKNTYIEFLNVKMVCVACRERPPHINRHPMSHRVAELYIGLLYLDFSSKGNLFEEPRRWLVDMEPRLRLVQELYLAQLESCIG